MIDYYKNLLTSLTTNNVKFIVVGGHALYLLNKKHDLDISIDVSKKDLDILIHEDSVDFIKQNFMSRLMQTNRINKFYPLYNHDKTKVVDIVISFPKRNFVIDGATTIGIDYTKLKIYSYTDTIYETSIEVANIEAYYGMTKASGLAKYKYVLDKILQKTQEIKQRVIA